MILEVTVLQIQNGQSEQFEKAFGIAQQIIQTSPGYIRHELQRCLEVKDKYILLVWWRTLADHEQGFRQSAKYQDWKQQLHPFYNPFPTVEHFEWVAGCVND